jgi:hypothetical protein
MSNTISTYDPVLKDHYFGDTAYDLADEDRPALADIQRNPRAGGKSGKIIQPVRYQNPGGGSAVYATAKTNETEAKFEDFQLTRRPYYQFASLSNELVEACQGDENSFEDVMDEIDHAFKNASARLARTLPRSSGGAIGRIASGTDITAAVATLDDPADAFNFQVGMLIVLSATNGGTARDSGDTLAVTAVDYEEGTVTFAENINTVSAAADTDFLTPEGDNGLCPLGVEDWIPVDLTNGGGERATALAATFAGVSNRGVNSARLGGLVRYANGEGLDESLIKGLATCRKHGAKINRAWANPETISDLMLLLQGQVVMNRTEIQGRGTIGFSAVEVVSGTQKVVLGEELSWPSNRMLLADWTTWYLHSAGEAPMFKQKAGLIQEHPTEDSWRVGIAAYHAFGCRAPGHNMNIRLS